MEAPKEDTPTSTVETETSKVEPLPRNKSLVKFTEQRPEPASGDVSTATETDSTTETTNSTESTENASEGAKESISETSNESTTEDAVGEDDGKEEKETESTPATTRTLLGCDVSHVGTEYPATRNRVAISFRKEIKRLEFMLYRAGDDSLKEIAENIAAGLNRLEERVAKRKSNTTLYK